MAAYGVAPVNVGLLELERAILRAVSLFCAKAGVILVVCSHSYLRRELYKGFVDASFGIGQDLITYLRIGDVERTLTLLLSALEHRLSS